MLLAILFCLCLVIFFGDRSTVEVAYSVTSLCFNLTHANAFLKQPRQTILMPVLINPRHRGLDASFRHLDREEFCLPRVLTQLADGIHGIAVPS